MRKIWTPLIENYEGGLDPTPLVATCKGDVERWSNQTQNHLVVNHLRSIF